MTVRAGRDWAKEASNCAKRSHHVQIGRRGHLSHFSNKIFGPVARLKSSGIFSPFAQTEAHSVTRTPIESCLVYIRHHPRRRFRRTLNWNRRPAGCRRTFTRISHDCSCYCSSWGPESNMKNPALAISLFTSRPRGWSSIQSCMNCLLSFLLYKALRFELGFLWLIPILRYSKVLVTCLAGRHPSIPLGIPNLFLI